MRYLALLVFLLYFTTAIAQEEPLAPLLETSPVSNRDISINLYTIDLDNIKIPITLSYNNTGIKVTEIPSPLGLSWKLADIGKITRIMNHIPDEVGWFRQNVPVLQYNCYNCNPSLQLTYDTSPDYHIFNSSSGLTTSFVYKKNLAQNGSTLLNVNPVQFDANKNFTINTNFTNFLSTPTNYQGTMFTIIDDENTSYKFISGPGNSTIARNNGPFWGNRDFYVHEIASGVDNDIITIEYEENIKRKFAYISGGVDSDPETEEIPSIGAYYQDYTKEGISTLEVKEIVTPKEIIKFLYIDVPVGIGTIYSQQFVKQLYEIEIYNTHNEYVTGYRFDYQAFQDGRFLLLQIGKYNQSKTEMMILHSFEYYPGSPAGIESFSQDTFGYSNGMTNNTSLLPFNILVCNSPTILSGPSRIYDFDNMLKGMLKKKINNLGGTTEYFYQPNADNKYYGGGLVISKIIESPQFGSATVTSFTYDNLKGFVLPKLDFHPFFKSSFLYIGGTFSNRQVVFCHPLKYHDTNPLDMNPAFANYKTQKSGNYFSDIYVKTLIDGYYSGTDIGDVNLVTHMKFSPNYEGITRRPNLTQKSIYKEYSVNQNVQNIIQISDNFIEYDLLSNSHVLGTEKDNPKYTSCNGTAYAHQRILHKPTYIIYQPIRKSILYEHNNQDLNSLYNTSTTITEKNFKYVGDDFNGNYFDKLRPKEIITKVNNTFVSKNKISYLFEILPNSGLTGLSQFSTQEKTLLAEESSWNFSPENQWILKESKFYQYYNDGKLKSFVKAHKNHSNNTFYSEASYNPIYIDGNLTGVSLDNQIDFTYNTYGKLNMVIDHENGKYEMFSRLNDKDPYTVNTTLEGNIAFYNNDIFYRNSFEVQSSNVSTLANAFTGKRVFTGATLNIGTYPSGYIVSFWYYMNNKWQFSTTTHTGGVVSITMPNGANYLDEVWVRPNNTILSGYTYEPLVGKTASINDRGQVLKTIFDTYGRDVKQADKDNNLINKKVYNLIQD